MQFFNGATQSKNLEDTAYIHTSLKTNYDGKYPLQERRLCWLKTKSMHR